MCFKNYFAIILLGVSITATVFAQGAPVKDPAAIAAENKRIEASNAAMKKALIDGNLAYTKKDYDGAVTIYDAAINADPTHPGVPSLLMNKAAAQMQRGVEIFNSSVTAKNKDLLESGKRYLVDAAITSTKSVALAKTLKYDSQNILPILAMRKSTLRLAVTKAGFTEVAGAASAYNEYVDAETDAAKKLQARAELGDVFFATGDYERAKIEFEKAYKMSPINAPVLAGLGTTLFFIGAQNDDALSLQRSANLLKAFLAGAAAGDPKRSDAEMMLNELKAAHNIIPK